MKCSVCGGTGQINPPHVPANRGGWMDEIYTFGTMCGACNGSGYLQDDEDILDEDILTEDDAFEPTSQTLEERMIDLLTEILFEDISDDLPAQLRERWYRMLDGVNLFEAGIECPVHVRIHGKCHRPARSVERRDPFCPETFQHEQFRPKGPRCHGRQQSLSPESWDLILARRRIGKSKIAKLISSLSDRE